MKNVALSSIRVALASAFFAASSFVSLPNEAAAAEAEKKAGASVVEQLNQLKGQKAQLHLRSGKEIEGVVGAITKDAVELRNLVGREFFDAVIRIDDIAAVVYRVRS